MGGWSGAIIIAKQRLFTLKTTIMNSSAKNNHNNNNNDNTNNNCNNYYYTVLLQLLFVFTLVLDDNWRCYRYCYSTMRLKLRIEVYLFALEIKRHLYNIP